MRILGIDPSRSGSGIYLTNPSHQETIRTSGANIGARLSIIEERVSLLLRENPALIVIEGYDYNSPSLAAAAEVGGIIRVIIHRAGVWDRLRVVPPSSLKKFARDKGSGDKKVIRAAVLARWGIDFKDDNQCDAFVLAKIGECLVKGPIAWSEMGITMAQFEVLKAVSANPRGEMQRVLDARKKKTG